MPRMNTKFSMFRVQQDQLQTGLGKWCPMFPTSADVKSKEKTSSFSHPLSRKKIQTWNRWYPVCLSFFHNLLRQSILWHIVKNLCNTVSQVCFSLQLAPRGEIKHISLSVGQAELLFNELRAGHALNCSKNENDPDTFVTALLLKKYTENIDWSTPGFTNSL